MSGGHLTLSEMRACARGEDEALIPVAVKHCRECEECARRMAATLAMTATKKSSSGMLLLGGVAAAILVLAAFSLLRPPEAPVVEVHPLAHLATTEPPPEFIVRFQLGEAAPVSSGSFLGHLQIGGMLIAKEQYEDAIAVLRPALESAPYAHSVAAYLGVASYLAGDTSASTRELLARSEIVEDEAIQRLGLWYYANYLVKVGEVSEAEQVLRRPAPQPQRYGRYAAELLEQLRR